MDGKIEYLLHLADNAAILGQRNSEWCGHGPILEEDLAMANIGLDLIGQARMLYQHAATLIGNDATEDTLAYFREPHEYRNYVLVELPNHGPLVGYAKSDLDYASTIVRNFLYSSFAMLLWDRLQHSSDHDLAAIAIRSFKESKYHLVHSRDCLIRFGDGTKESHCRAQAALDYLFSYTEEFWVEASFEKLVIESCVAPCVLDLKSEWNAIVNQVFVEATLNKPVHEGYIPEGKKGIHSEHLTYLLLEMQSLARSDPAAVW